jgi:hypothetical protein
MLLAELNIKEQYSFRRIPDFCLYGRMLFETREITSMTRRRWRCSSSILFGFRANDQSRLSLTMPFDLKRHCFWYC